MRPRSSQAFREQRDRRLELEVDRRTVIVGAGCFALAARLPGGAQAVRWVRTRARLTAATLPRQSPIDLRQDEITFVRRLPKIRFGYPRRIGVSLENTGDGEFDTVRANVPPGAAHITLSGIPWELLQFHWHTRLRPSPSRSGSWSSRSRSTCETPNPILPGALPRRQ
jgi:hypothetical protein